MRRSAKLLPAFLAASFLVTAAGAQPAATRPAAVDRAWGFDRGDLPPHPGVRFGVLANGMRYALMRGPSPATGTDPGSLSVRLHVDAGSTAEGAREPGAMHLIEHMIFEGSANLPKGALLLMLPHQGLRRFSDFNAFTTYDETVYRLDLRQATRGARDTALMLMREIATNLRFTDKGVREAKRMVMTEIGERDAMRDRLATAQNAFFVPGTPIARGPVAGTRTGVSRARAGVLRRLYARTYDPRRVTLIVVGDFDPAAVESEVAARFADWPAPAVMAPDPAPPSISRDRGIEARVFVDREAPTVVTVATARPLGGPDAGARRDAVYLEHLGAEMLTRRLARIGARVDAPVGGSAEIYDHFSTARLALIEVPAADRDWRGAVRRAASELGRALDGGFSQAELDALRAASRSAPVNAAPPTATALADTLVDAVGRGIVFTAPGDPSASAAYLARIRLADVNEAFRAAWADRTRLIFVLHDRAIPNAPAAIVATWTDGLRTAKDAMVMD